MNTKITSLITGLVLTASGSLLAQTSKGKIHQHNNGAPAQRTCGTMEHHEYLKQTRKNYEKEFIEYNKMIDEYLKKEENSAKKTAANITIPVVVHIVYSNSTENISDLRATEQVTVLNEDFQKTNSDTTLIPSIFKSRAAGTNVTFCLAQRDPNGNATTGIVRKATTVTSFSGDEVKSTAAGGDDPWDVSKYVNIWVCDLGTQLLGYAEFPTSSLSNTYGLVLNYRYTGKTGAGAPYNKGRTGTHEFGHCFNLYHIWGDDGTACTGSDAVADTPNQKGENGGMPTFPQGTSASGGCCNAADQSSMYMNYMDYTNDAGMMMFTTGQIARVNAVINNPPWNILQSSDGCIPVNLVANDAGIFNVTSPTGTLCAGSFQPVATLKNMGSADLTSCTINYNIDGGANSTYSWTGTLASLATTNVTLPAITATAGTHTVNVFTSSPNGGSDGNAGNDLSSTTYTALANNPGLTLPYSEGFESGTFPAGQNITLDNPDVDVTWDITNTTAFSGSQCMFMDNWNYASGAGQKDEAILPSLNLSGAGTTSMTFQVAYTYWSSTGYSDTLEILASGDCGATWSTVYKKWREILQTAPLVSSNSVPFTPSGASQWRQETVDLSAFDGNNNVKVMFRSISDYEDNLYVDDINISKTIGLKEKNNGVYFNVFPNPSNGVLNIAVTNNTSNSNAEITIYNVLGEKVVSNIITKGTYSTQTIDITSLANGIYQVEVKSNGLSTFKKVVLNK